MKTSPFLFLLCGLYLSCLSASFGASSKTIQVPIYVYAALAEQNSFVSEASRKEFLHHISLSETVANTLANRCGYKFNFSTYSFIYSDNLGLFNSISSIPKEKAPWLIIAPKQSNQYTIVASAAKDTPSISPMASSKEVFNLGPLHKTLGIGNEQLVSELLRSIPKLFNTSLAGRSYVSIARSGSLNSKDFIETFDRLGSQSGLKKLNSFVLHSDADDLSPLKQWVLANKPNYILLPIKGDIAALVIQALHSLSPSSVFIGGDSWGDSDIGSIASMSRPDTLQGVMIRPLPPAQRVLNGLKSKQLIAKALSGHVQMAAGLSYSVIAEQLANFVCTYKPKDAGAFKQTFTGNSHLFFQPAKHPAIYLLSKGKFSYVEND